MIQHARCAIEPKPYLRSSAMANTSEALAMFLPTRRWAEPRVLTNTTTLANRK